MPRLLTRAAPVLDQAFELNRDSMQARGLRAWWPTVASRGAGTLRDLSNRGYAGTLTGPLWTPDPLTGATLDFDNTDDYVNLGDSTTVVTTGQPFTLAWWERVKAGSGVYPSRFRLPISGGTEAFAVLRSSDAAYERLAFGKANSTNTVFRLMGAPTLAASVDIWYLWTLVGRVGPEDVGTAANWAAYVNGASYTVEANTTFGSFGNTIARIGYDGADNAANCQMADIRIYDRPLSAAEVWQLWAPQTRWELYRPAKRRTWILPAGAAGGALPARRALLGVGV